MSTSEPEVDQIVEKAKSLKIAQFVFALPSHNANVCSLMQSQWTKERNQFSLESLKGILFVQHQFKDTFILICRVTKNC